MLAPLAVFHLLLTSCAGELKGYAMNHDIIDLEESEEESLAFEISDEALEAAAGSGWAGVESNETISCHGRCESCRCSTQVKCP